MTGNGGVRRDYARQVRRSARTRDDDANTALRGFARVVGGAIGRAMRRGHVDLKRNSEFIKSFSGLAHDLQVGVASHYD